MNYTPMILPGKTVGPKVRDSFSAEISLPCVHED